MSSQNPVDRDAENTWENLEEGCRQAVIALRDFARQREKDFQTVISLSPSELGVLLKDFYLHLRNQSEDEPVAVSQLHHLRSDLNEYFKQVMDVDITKGPEFADCNGIMDENSPKDTGSKNTIMKKHSRQRTFTFETNELRQIYMSDAMNLDQPETLQNKVFFDICMYICNRGKDFLRLMTKNDFEVSTDQNGRRYVWLKFNSKFSFSEVAGGTTAETAQGSQIGERMYERPGDPKCPVLSYTQYVIHLHPMSDAFWQRPKRSVLPTDIVWYDNQSIGNSTLNKLMNRITQSAGLPDSYAINAIKSSYIPIIESICRSALFGSQQFRRILHMKQTHHDMHYVRKRHSEGSLTIASQLRESPLFRLRHSEPLLPMYNPQKLESDQLPRSSSSSPVTRVHSWDAGPSHLLLRPTAERLDKPPDAGYQSYRNCESDMVAYQQKYRDTGQNGGLEAAGNQMRCSPPGNSHLEGSRKRNETGSSILEAKLSCLGIVNNLEVRDIKSFINWMKTFEVKHEASGLMVTCQPVNDLQQQQQQIARCAEQNGVNGFGDHGNQDAGQQQLGNRGLPDREQRDFEAKDLEFDCIGDTFCCTSDISPLKITIPAQDTLVLTGLQADSQVLIHRNKDEKQSDQKYSPLHCRIFSSNDNFSLDNVKSVIMNKPPTDNNAGESNYSQELTRSSFKEEKSIPMKKRTVMDQSDPNPAGSHSNSPVPLSQSRSPPQNFPRHSSPLAYMAQQQQQNYMQNHNAPRASGLVTAHHQAVAQSASYPPPQGHSGNSSHHHGYTSGQGHPPVSESTQNVQPIPKYRERFPDGWGYIPLQKRQKFGIHTNHTKDDGPLDLIKQS